MKKALYILCAVCAVPVLVVSPLRVFDAPLDSNLYFNQKIFYYHVPSAFVLFLSIFVCGIASIAYLKTRRDEWDDVAVSAGWLSVIFGAMLLTSGPIWAKPAWGHFWVWEARLTTSLLLYMVCIAYMLLRKYGGLGSERLSAGLAIFAMANVPLVYFAVNFWKTMHPSNSVVPKLSGEMRTVFWGGPMIGYLLLYVLLLGAAIRIRRGERRYETIFDEYVDD